MATLFGGINRLKGSICYPRYMSKADVPKSKLPESFCPAPFNTLHLHPQGKWRVCCISQENLDTDPATSWNSEKTQKMRQEFLEGKKPDACISCWHKEDLGGTSQRQRLQQALTYKDIAKKSQELNPYNKKMDLDSLLYMDLSFSNRCNLKCRFCGPHNSSNWHGDSQQLLKQDSKFWEKMFTAEQRVFDADVDGLLKFINQTPNLKYLEIKGGEPFIDEKHLLFLKELVKSGRASNLILTITTNGTLIHDDYFEYLKEFEAIYMTCSVDGTGKVYQYVRGGSYSLENHVVPNLVKLNTLKNLRLNIHFTLCNYNIFEIQSTYDWFLELKDKLPIVNRWQYGILYGPQPLSHLALPKEFKESIIENIDSRNEDLKKIIKTLIRTSDSEYYTSGKALKDFWKYTNQLDELRNESLLEIEPRFSALSNL